MKPLPTDATSEMDWNVLKEPLLTDATSEMDWNELKDSLRGDMLIVLRELRRWRDSDRALPPSQSMLLSSSSVRSIEELRDMDLWIASMNVKSLQRVVHAKGVSFPWISFPLYER